MENIEPFFESVKVSKYYGGVVALKNVSFSIPFKGIYGFYGGNGSGKTTLFDIACGLTNPDEGEIRFYGRVITDLPPIKRGALRLGFTRTFQEPRLFPGLTAIENVLMGYQFTSGITFTGSLFKIKQWKKQYKQAYELVRFYLSMFSLEGIGNRLAKELSFGQQKRLELIRAFISPANFFWFDEPFTGLDSAIIGLTVEKIIKCVKEKDGILCLIDHRKEIVKEISDKVFQFSYGNMIVDKQECTL